MDELTKLAGKLTGASTARRARVDEAVGADLERAVPRRALSGAMTAVARMNVPLPIAPVDPMQGRHMSLRTSANLLVNVVAPTGVASAGAVGGPTVS